MTVAVQQSELQADQQVADQQVVARAETMTDQNVTAMTGQRVHVATMIDQVDQLLVVHAEMTRELHDQDAMMIDQSVTAMIDQHVHDVTMTDQNALVMKNLNVASGQASVPRQAMIANEMDDQVAVDQVQDDQGSVAMIVHAVADQIVLAENLPGVNAMSVHQDTFQKKESTLMIR